jgi:uncharacterized membrane protein YqjE
MAVQEPGQGVDARDRSMGELLKQLSTDTSTLVKQEIQLLRAELQETGKQAGKGAGLFGAAGVVGLLAGIAFTACLILALDEFMKDWLAALIVAVVFGAVAAVLALRGKTEIKQATPPAPQTVETLKEDGRWAKTRT